MSTTTAPQQAAIPAYGRPAWRRFLLTPEMSIIALLAIVVVVASFSVRKFSTPLTFTYLILDMMTVLLIALPMTLVMITGDIDLSVGSVVGLSSVAVGLMVSANVPMVAIIVVTIAMGALAGLFNGLLVTRMALPSLAVTIGTMALYRGIAVGLLGTTAITTFPKEWTTLAKANIPGTPIPMVTILFLILLAAFAILLHFTPFGRGVYAIGLSKEAATFSGMAVARTRVTLFILSGAVAALAGIFYTLRFGSARGDNATGLELQVIAAVVLGGVSVFGGRGALYGVVAGALLIGVLSSALRLAGVTSDVINIITGVLLIASVMANRLMAWAQTRRKKPRPSGSEPSA